MAAHRPPFGDGNSISGYNLFLSAFHGFAQLGDEHVPLPQRFETFPIFSLDFAGSRHDAGKLELEFNLTLCGTDMQERYRVLGKIQLDVPGAGRNPGKMRNYLSDCVPSGKVSKIIFSVLAESILDMYQIHVRYLLLDSVTGYRSQYHTLSTVVCMPELN